MERHEDEDSRILNSNFDLDHVGEVSLTLNSDELSWIKVDSFNKNNDTGSSCLGKQLVSRRSTTIKFSDAYAVEFIDWGVIHEPVLGNAPGRLLGRASEMFRFTVHCFRRSKTQPSLWKTSIYTFGHKDLGTCHLWVTRINFSLNMEVGRPKSLLI
nr:PREDICTED: ceramide kinase-like isoform X4 [Daucus carota subsp. sativus]